MNVGVGVGVGVRVGEGEEKRKQEGVAKGRVGEGLHDTGQGYKALSTRILDPKAMRNS